MKIFTLGMAIAVAMTGTAMAADYPDRPVTIVVPFSAGGGTDSLTRYMAQELSEYFSQQFLVENLAGAGGNIGTSQTKDAEPDGYTLLMLTPATTINHTLYEQPGYDALTDFTPISGWANAPLLFVASPDFAPNTLPEVTAYAKEHPGELQFSSGGVGLINTEVMELYKIEAGIDILQIPYQGMAPAITALMSGVVPISVDSIASSSPFIEGGKVKALAVTSPERIEQFPDLPTVVEQGYPNLVARTWYGPSAPDGTPQDIIDTLNKAIGEIQARPEVAERIKAMGADPFVTTQPEFADFVSNEVNRWASVIKTSGLSVQ